MVGRVIGERLGTEVTMLQVRRQDDLSLLHLYLQLRLTLSYLQIPATWMCSVQCPALTLSLRQHQESQEMPTAERTIGCYVRLKGLCAPQCLHLQVVDEAGAVEEVARTWPLVARGWPDELCPRL
jgi:hypothetical protein